MPDHPLKGCLPYSVFDENSQEVEVKECFGEVQITTCLGMELVSLVKLTKKEAINLALQILQVANNL